jgi:hypothetical protein
MSEFRRVEGFHGARHEFRRSAAPMGGRWRRMASARPRSRQQGPTRSATVTGTRSAMWASRVPSAATGSARCASSAELGDDCRPTPPPVSRYMQPTPARHSRICASSRHPHDTRGFAQAADTRTTLEDLRKQETAQGGSSRSRPCAATRLESLPLYGPKSSTAQTWPNV